MKTLPNFRQIQKQHMNRIAGLVLCSVLFIALSFVVAVIYAMQGVNELIIAVVAMISAMAGTWWSMTRLSAKCDLHFSRMASLIRFMEGKYADTPMGARIRIADRELLEEWKGFEEWRILKLQNQANQKPIS